MPNKPRIMVAILAYEAPELGPTQGLHRADERGADHVSAVIRLAVNAQRLVTASGSSVPVTRISTLAISDVGMLVAADNPAASSPAGRQEPTTICPPLFVVTTMS